MHALHKEDFMIKTIISFVFILSMSAFAETHSYQCTGTAEFCMSSERTDIQTTDLSTVCDDMYKASAADLVVNVTCLDQNESVALKIERCK
jgi:hypothetical protein